MYALRFPITIGSLPGKRLSVFSRSVMLSIVNKDMYNLMRGVYCVIEIIPQLTTFVPQKHMDSTIHPYGRSLLTRPNPYCAPPIRSDYLLGAHNFLPQAFVSVNLVRNLHLRQKYQVVFTKMHGTDGLGQAKGTAVPNIISSEVQYWGAGLQGPALVEASCGAGRCISREGCHSRQALRWPCSPSNSWDSKPSKISPYLLDWKYVVEKQGIPCGARRFGGSRRRIMGTPPRRSISHGYTCRVNKRNQEVNRGNCVGSQGNIQVQATPCAKRGAM